LVYIKDISPTEIAKAILKIFPSDDETSMKSIYLSVTPILRESLLHAALKHRETREWWLLDMSGGKIFHETPADRLKRFSN
jgi:hypothetical protein